MKIPQKLSEVTEAFADEWYVGLPIRPLRNMDVKNTRQHLAEKLLGNKDAEPTDITRAWLALTPEEINVVLSATSAKMNFNTKILKIV